MNLFFPNFKIEFQVLIAGKQFACCLHHFGLKRIQDLHKGLEVIILLHLLIAKVFATVLTFRLSNTNLLTKNSFFLLIDLISTVDSLFIDSQWFIIFDSYSMSHTVWLILFLKLFYLFISQILIVHLIFRFDKSVNCFW